MNLNSWPPSAAMKNMAISAGSRPKSIHQVAERDERGDDDASGFQPKTPFTFSNRRMPRPDRHPDAIRMPLRTRGK